MPLTKIKSTVTDLAELSAAIKTDTTVGGMRDYVDTQFGLTLGTPIATTSGTSHDFTGIPSWAKRITIMFNGVSTNGASPHEFRMGTSGGIEATGYAGVVTVLFGASYGADALSTGFRLRSYSAVNVMSGTITLTLLGAASNTWMASGVFAFTQTDGTGHVAGTKTLSGTLDRIRLTTINGTDAFDAGSVNIMYE